MSATTLTHTTRALVAPGKGILAADESHATIGRRFEALGIPNSEEQRRRYRQMLFTTKGVSEFVSGVILFDETIRQSADDGRPFVEVLASEGIIPGTSAPVPELANRVEAAGRRSGRAGDRRARRASRAAG